MSLLLLAGLLGCPEPAAPVAAALPTPLAADPTVLPPEPVARAEAEGVAIEAFVAPIAGGPLVAGADATVAVRLSYAAGGRPWTGGRPAAWLDRVEEPSDTAECQAAASRHLEGSLLGRAAVDLNSWHVVVLSSDPTLIVVDPVFGYGGTRQLAQVALSAPGEDWTQIGHRLYVTEPAAGRVAIVDTRTWAVEEVDVGSNPTRVVALGAEAWVATDEGVVTLGAEGVRQRLATGRTLDLVADVDLARVFIGSEGGLWRLADGALTAVSTAPVRALAWSDLAASAWVATDDAVHAFGPDGAVQGQLDLQGVRRISFAPDGRTAIALAPDRDAVHVLDATQIRTITSVTLRGAPVEVVYSSTLAYIRLAESELVWMVPLTALRRGGPLPIVDVSSGQAAIGGAVAHAASIVRSPEGGAVLFANPADDVVYEYREGMAAPMGSFKAYGHAPRAVRTVDRSLQEGAPGVYRTQARLPEAGLWELVLFQQNPAFTRCLTFDVGPAPDAAPAVSIEQLGPENGVVGAPIALRFRARKGGEPLVGLTDVGVSVIGRPGGWHTRAWATGPGDAGVYEVVLTPREVGAFQVYVEAPSAGLALTGLPPFPLTVAPS